MAHAAYRDIQLLTMVRSDCSIWELYHCRLWTLALDGACGLPTHIVTDNGMQYVLCMGTVSQPAMETSSLMGHAAYRDIRLLTMVSNDGTRGLQRQTVTDNGTQ